MATLLAKLSLLASGLSLLCLLLLHAISPEFAPSWRMISEYALGRHGWLLTTFFLLWALGSMLLAAMLWGQVSGTWAKVGVVLLLLSAVGAAMGGLFDLKHKLHGMAFALGVPTLPLAALLIGHHLAAREPWSANSGIILSASHATWISVVLMGVAMAVMFAGFRKAGLPMGPDATPPDRVPAGVIALGGYANRLLVLCHVGWLLAIAGIFLAVSRR
jgi:hypothetical membrane protein